MEKKLRIGMIGCGQIMPHTAETILSSKRCEMAYLYDIDHAAAKQMSEKFNVPSTETLWELLEKPDVDVVYCAVPHAVHAPIGIEAARAGKHVIVEKPFASNYEDGVMLKKECEKQKVLLSANMPVCFAPRSRLTRELIARGAIGNITSTRILELGCKGDSYWSNGVGGRAKRSYWRGFTSFAGGGILIMNAVHFLDSMYYITGLRPVEVAAMGGTYVAKAAVEDSIAVTIRYNKNNAYGVCEAMSSAHGASRSDNDFVIYGEKGTIRYNIKQEVELCTTVEGFGVPLSEWTVVSSDRYKDTPCLFDDFAAAVFDGSPLAVTAEQGLIIVDTITSAYRSMRSGRFEALQGNY